MSSETLNNEKDKRGAKLLFFWSPLILLFWSCFGMVELFVRVSYAGHKFLLLFLFTPLFAVSMLGSIKVLVSREIGVLFKLGVCSLVAICVIYSILGLAFFQNGEFENSIKWQVIFFGISILVSFVSLLVLLIFRFAQKPKEDDEEYIDSERIMRFSSFLIDVPIAIFATSALFSIMELIGFKEKGVIDLKTCVLAPVFFHFTYFIQELILQQTVGKITCSLKVRKLDDRPLFLVILLRYVGRCLPFEAMSIGMREDGRMWHDLISNTVVVSVKKKPKKNQGYVPPSEKVNVLSEEEAVEFESH